MTRAEAIKQIEAFRTCMIVDDAEPYVVESLNMAVEALEREPCEDAISRQAAIDGLASIAKAKAKSDAQKSLMGRVMFFTEHLPPVTPQPKIGHWIEKDGFDGDTYYDCSECGESFCLIDGTPTDNLYNHCPNCGAKMQEVKDE